VIALAALMTCALLTTGALCFALGAAVERYRWRRRVDVPRCWRCDGTGAEPYLERGLHERWRGEP
jgi:hypothetical protein